MVILGYVTCIAYVFFLIFIIGPIVKSKSNGETSRKVIHTMLFVVWVLIDIFFRDSIHQIILPVIFIVLNSLSYKFKFYKSVERAEGNHLGTVYFAIAITGVMTATYFMPEMYYASGIAAFCLTIGDGLAAMVGYNTNSPKILPSKSVYGTSMCILASAVSLLIFSAIYGVELSLFSIVLVSILTGIFELTGKGLDNFTISFGVFIVAGALLNVYSDELITSIALSIIIFAIVFFSKAIDYAGSILSMVIVFSFSYFGEKYGIAYLLATYFTIFCVSIFKKRIRKHERKSHPRTFMQILINGGLGTLFVVLYGITKNTSHLLVCVVAIGGCFIDSVSSDIGVLSSKEPIDIIRLKPIGKGLSGGVSVLGTCSAIIGSLGIALFSAVLLKMSLMTSIIIGGLCFLQTLLDSIMGSLMQAKYMCTSCGELNEKAVCCGIPSKRISGVCWINNNVVNAATSIIVVAIATVFFVR